MAKATEILDILHVCAYLWEATNRYRPNAPEAARALAKADLGRILHGEQ